MLLVTGWIPSTITSYLLLLFQVPKIYITIIIIIFNALIAMVVSYY